MNVKRRFPNLAFRGGMNVLSNKKGFIGCADIILLPLFSPDPGGPFRYLLDSAKYPSHFEVLQNGPEMSYEHDRNGFGKLLIPPFRKYIHYRVYLLLIFVKKAKRKFSQTLNTWKMTEISKVSVGPEKQDFVSCALSAAQLHFYDS